VALTEYQTRTQNLLQYPLPSSSAAYLYTTADITRWVNQARLQLAVESHCIRRMGTVPTVVDQREYAFSSISFGVAATTGVAGAMHVRMMDYNIASGRQFVYPRPWEWFMFYNLNNPVPSSGAPVEWSQFKQGAAGTSTQSDASGSFYVDPIPDLVYTMNVDCVCYPIELTDNSTVEAIPFEWTEAVPFFAAFYALMSSQTGARTADAERIYNMYNMWSEKARAAANPSVNRWMYSNSPDPTMMQKLGVTPGAGGQPQR